VLYCTVKEEWENCGNIDWLSWLELDRREGELKRAMTLKGS
jgi:hypothetical protein